ncbi:hypothetical protein AVEN_132658-1 [Araneus ventricosus]|uniref:Uncharacterized protein n=1 Tax=Araneus ventricosus TaxID=182803 RepID=A0A4Y2AVL0_ARAVE|nr:hypothetical protein AVEN_132658-1 [Araneus ventricosus]
MTRTTPELAPRSPNFHATTGGRLATAYDLACNRPHTRQICSGMGFRIWNPPVQSRDSTTSKIIRRELSEVLSFSFVGNLKRSLRIKNE